MRSASQLCILIAALALLAVPADGGPAEPKFSPTGPDAADYGEANGYPIGTRATSFQIPFLVGAQSHLDQILPSRDVASPETAFRFKRAAEEPQITYLSGVLTVDDYLQRHPATGLLILKDDTILLERYQYARTDQHRFTSHSMAKTVTAMLVGIAISDGKIRSVDDRADAYVPELKGTEYGGTSLRALLNMSSGVEFREVYDGKDDIAKMSRDLHTPGPGKNSAIVVAQFNNRIEPAGAKFKYSSIETEILGIVLARAVGMPVADYLSEKIWRRIGAEAKAAWIVDVHGQEMTYCCLNAVLRDYARLGRLLAHDGAWPDGNGKVEQIIPRQWVVDATSVRTNDDHLRPGTATRFFGYGYQVWLFPGDTRQFAFLGIRGQVIFVDPASKLVMVQTAVRKLPSNDPTAAQTIALWQGVVKQLGTN
ncbi:MAG: serine hydrolase [Alphaproteobacteria bacterium]|nr:serine hydrolase [Alphaproteobacteria bacterium]